MITNWPRVDLLSHRVEVSPDREILLDTTDGSTRTAAALHSRAGRLAETLESTVGAGDRVALLLGTSPTFVEVFWAVRRLGGTVVPLNTRRSVEQLEAHLERVAPSLLICESETEDLAMSLSADPVLSVDPPKHGGPDVLTPAEEGLDAEPSSTDCVAVILFTSGTTGDPKAVPLTVGNLVWSALGSALRLGVSVSDRWLCCLPMYHTGGISPIIRTVVYGSMLAVQPEFDVSATIRNIDAHALTGVSLVPTMLHRLLSAEWEPPDRLQTVLLGGAPAGGDLIKRALTAGVPVAPTYGLTEAASQVATARPGTVETQPESVGPPLLPTEVTLVDADGSPVPTGETGEIVVAGPTVTSGYLDETRNASAFGDYGLHTGDLGRRDDTGRLWIQGRLDDRIVTGGEIVNPEEVAAVLEQHPGVDRVAVVGIPDPEWGEQVGALVTATGDETPTESELEQHSHGSLAEFEVPRIWGRAEHLPRTSSGTVDREAVQKRLTAQREE